MRVRDRDHAHAGGVRGADPVGGVLDRGATLGSDVEAARRLEEDVRRGLAARDLLGRDGDLEVAASPADARTASMMGRFDDDASASRKLPASRSTASTAPSMSGRRSA